MSALGKAVAGNAEAEMELAELTTRYCDLANKYLELAQRFYSMTEECLARGKELKQLKAERSEGR